MLPLPFTAGAIALDYGDTDYPYSVSSPHNGLDFSSSSRGIVAGCVIRASGDGVVHRSGWELGSQSPTIDRPNVNAGNSIDVDYPAYGVRVRYMHRPRGCASPEAGDPVAFGSPLGVIGATGYVFGAHLHMETWDLATGRRVSPWLFFTRDHYVGDGSAADDGGTPFNPPTPGTPTQSEEDDMNVFLMTTENVDGAGFTQGIRRWLINPWENSKREISTEQEQVFKGAGIRAIAGLQPKTYADTFRTIG